jgi:hypothetical protein
VDLGTAANVKVFQSHIFEMSPLSKQYGELCFVSGTSVPTTQTVQPIAVPQYKVLNVT